MKSSLLSSIAFAGLAVSQQYPYHFPNCEDGTIASNKVCDRGLSPPERAAAIVEALNITEKLGNLIRYVGA
jgi:xylan 1,4-beta-xylosidase